MILEKVLIIKKNVNCLWLNMALNRQKLSLMVNFIDTRSMKNEPSLMSGMLPMKDIHNLIIHILYALLDLGVISLTQTIHTNLMSIQTPLMNKKLSS